ncbi:MAG TPA: carboxymuconolactone decarboxylase family protein [Bacteroidia bacterium]|jgi:alkylhydroperoxidase family enzyme|nr:carboxymuconolactone decarboxylase family protein [Bacteroidia bacterium]
METYLSPIEKPQSLLWKIIYSYSRKAFGKVITPLKISSVRLPFGFALFSMKIGKLDKKLQLPAEKVMLVRQQVARINVCLFCIDIARMVTVQASMNQAKFDALENYNTSSLFSEAERAMLDFVTLLTRERRMDQETFAKLKKHYSEREICEIVWIISTEFYYNIGNIGLNIHSDMLCEVRKK